MSDITFNCVCSSNKKYMFLDFGNKQCNLCKKTLWNIVKIQKYVAALVSWLKICRKSFSVKLLVETNRYSAHSITNIFCNFRGIRLIYKILERHFVSFTHMLLKIVPYICSQLMNYSIYLFFFYLNYVISSALCQVFRTWYKI